MLLPPFWPRRISAAAALQQRTTAANRSLAHGHDGGGDKPARPAAKPTQCGNHCAIICAANRAHSLRAGHNGRR